MEPLVILYIIIAFAVGATIGCLIFTNINSKDVAVLNNEIAHLNKQIQDDNDRHQKEILQKEEDRKQQLSALEQKHDELYAEQDKRHEESVVAMKGTRTAKS